MESSRLTRLGARPEARPAAASDSLTRRDAVRRLAAGAAGLVALPLLQGCRGVVRASAGDGPAHDGRGIHLEPRLREILYYASLAPSGYNAQPWVVRVPTDDRLLRSVDGSRFLVGVDRRRRLPAVDPDGRGLMLAMGAFLENLALAAGTLGRAAEYRLLAARADDAELAELLEVRLTPAVPGGYSLERIAARRTVRNGYLDRPLAPADVAALVEAGGEGTAFFPAGSAEARYLAEGTIEANRAQAAREEARLEMANWIRWSDRDCRWHRDGLTPESMEMTGLTGLYVRHFMNRRPPIAPRNRALGVDAARAQVRAGGGWLVMTSSDSSLPALLDAGRRFERLLLGVRERTIAAHPMMQMLEEAPFVREAAARLGAGGRAVQLLLRVGYLRQYPEPVSLRRPVSWFVQPWEESPAVAAVAAGP